MKSNTFLSVAMLLLALMAGCSTPGAQPPASASLSPAPSPGTPAAPAAKTAIAPTSAITPTSNVLTLTWWTPEFISPRAPQPGGPLMATYLVDFEAANEGTVRVNAVLKARYGKGGVLDFLRTAQPVAPGILPDIITLDVTELEQAAALGLLHPLDELLDAEAVAGLYPFARQAGRFDKQLLAVQYIANLEHLGYIRSRVETPPLTWAEFLAGKTPYLFPAGSPQPLSAASPPEDLQPGVIGQYLAAGGTMDPETRQLMLQEEPLLRVLSFYSQARKAGLIPEHAVDMTSLDDTWADYVQGLLPMAAVSAQRFLIEREGLPNIEFAATPGFAGPVTPVTSGWGLAIVTTDPVRQQAAASLIAWLLSPDRAGSWAQATGWLPTSPAAWATWGANPYYEFLDQQLASAVSHPSGPDYAQTAARMQRAVIAVLKGAASPEEAAQTALSASK
ncbi:MAG: hypothetical protein CVU38_15900 [Chloroflexi bacterium HGW-Chloroflexi-1]|nr:MAG: hypothetical protein CVU38_15900 [Chloroflexi bacterium HGW-Chloroflexi-1]